MQVSEFVDKYGITSTAVSRPGFYQDDQRRAAWWCTLSRGSNCICFAWAGPIGMQSPPMAHLMMAMAREAVYSSGTLVDWLRADGLKDTLAHRNRWQEWRRNRPRLEQWASVPGMWNDLLSLYPASS